MYTVNGRKKESKRKKNVNAKLDFFGFCIFMMMMLQMSFLKLRNRRAGNTEFFKFFFFLQLFVYFLEIHQKMHNFFTSYAHLTVCLMQNKTKEMKDTVFQNDPKCLIFLPKKS